MRIKYQRKYFDRLAIHSCLKHIQYETIDTHLTCAHLVERHKRKRLRQHRPRQIPLRQHQRNQYRAERQLRDKS